MLDGYLHYGLLCALAIALVVAAFTDIRRRQIDNWLTAAIALAAPLYWWAAGIDLWPGVGIQLGIALATLVVLAGFFALGWMGGGDVKLLVAIALWIEPSLFLQLLIIMALVGGVLTLVVGAWHIARRQRSVSTTSLPLARRWLRGEPDFNRSTINDENHIPPAIPPGRTGGLNRHG
jgi:prepilin peptidase CpaA